MSRRHAAERRTILPDVKYGDIIVAKLINCIMREGKKSVAERIVYEAFALVESRLKRSAVDVFKEAVKNVRPSVEVRSRRVGGATYQVPTDVRDVRSLALALRWLIQAAKKRSEKTMQERLAGEVIDAANGRGSAWKVNEDNRKMAEANRAFSHFRW